MRTAFITLAVAALAGCTAPPPVASNAPIAEIAGRVAGPAQRCVTTTQSQGLQAANRNTLLYRNGSKLWVNQLQDGCGGFGRWDVLVTEPIGTQYCRGDRDKPVVTRATVFECHVSRSRGLPRNRLARPGIGHLDVGGTGVVAGREQQQRCQKDVFHAGSLEGAFLRRNQPRE